MRDDIRDYFLAAGCGVFCLQDNRRCTRPFERLKLESLLI
jgi:hypothetical protein